jgi:hypothetical protein
MTDRSDPKFMPTFDEAIPHAQLGKWGQQPTTKPSGLPPADSHTTYYGTGTPGPGIKVTQRKSDVNF